MKKYKIYGYVAPENALDHSQFPGSIVIPQQLDLPLYSDGGVVEMGERISETWYSTYDEENSKLSDPVAKFLYKFDRDAKGFVIKVKTTVKYTYTNGEWSEQTKSWDKPVLSTDAKMREIKRRRENVVIDLKKRATDFKLSGAIGSLFKRYLAEIALYIESGDISLREAIKNNSEEGFEWLDRELPQGVTIRKFLVFNFSIGANEP